MPRRRVSQIVRDNRNIPRRAVAVPMRRPRQIPPAEQARLDSRVERINRDMTTSVPQDAVGGVKRCDTCIAERAGGGQCTRTTCKYSPRCWQHEQSASKFKLFISRSNLPGAGLGLFTSTDIPEFNIDNPPVGREDDHRTIITIYDGDKYPMRLWNQRTCYGVGLSNVDGQQTHVIDASRTNSSIARYMNDCRVRDRQRRGPGRGRVPVCTGPNVTVFQNHFTNDMVVAALRPIKAGEELYYNYGDAYWSDDRCGPRDPNQGDPRHAGRGQTGRPVAVRYRRLPCPPRHIRDHINFRCVSRTSARGKELIKQEQVR